MLLNISFDIWLMVGVIGFYIADSLTLSFHNEFLLAASASRRWHYVPRTAELAGKYLYVPHLFKPYQLLLKLKWHADMHGGQPGDELILPVRQLAGSLLVLQMLVICLALQILLLFPLTIYLYGLGVLSLLLMALIYSTILFAIAVVFFKRQQFNLSLSACTKLAFEVLACPPFAVNLLRKLGLSQSVSVDGLGLAECLLAADDYQQVLEDIIQEVDMMQVLLEDTDSTRYQQLQQYRLTLEQQKICR